MTDTTDRETIDVPVFFPVSKEESSGYLEESDVEGKTFNTMQDFKGFQRFKIFEVGTKIDIKLDTNLDSFLTIKLNSIIFDDDTSKEEIKKQFLHILERYKSNYEDLYNGSELPLFICPPLESPCERFLFDKEKKKHYEQFEDDKELKKGLDRRIIGLGKCEQKNLDERRTFYNSQFKIEDNLKFSEVKERCQALKFFDCKKGKLKKLVLGQSDMLNEENLCWTENKVEYCDDYVNWSIPYNLMIIACYSHFDKDFPIEFKFNKSNVLKKEESYIKITEDELKSYKLIGILAFPFIDNRTNQREACKKYHEGYSKTCCLTLYVYIPTDNR